jgi:phage-related protein
VIKKKQYFELKQVTDFIAKQSEAIKYEYRTIVEELEIKGRLEAPLGEKVEKDLFAIRVINAGNIRVFYVYVKKDFVYGIRGYEKKSQKIPQKELKEARKTVRGLKYRGDI